MTCISFKCPAISRINLVLECKSSTNHMNTQQHWGGLLSSFISSLSFLTCMMALGELVTRKRANPNRLTVASEGEKVSEHLSCTTTPPTFSRAKSNFPILSALYLARAAWISCSTSLCTQVRETINKQIHYYTMRFLLHNTTGHDFRLLRTWICAPYFSIMVTFLQKFMFIGTLLLMQGGRPGQFTARMTSVYT